MNNEKSNYQSLSISKNPGGMETYNHFQLYDMISSLDVNQIDKKISEYKNVVSKMKTYDKLYDDYTQQNSNEIHNNFMNKFMNKNNIKNIMNIITIIKAFCLLILKERNPTIYLNKLNFTFKLDKNPEDIDIDMYNLITTMFYFITKQYTKWYYENAYATESELINGQFIKINSNRTDIINRMFVDSDGNSNVEKYLRDYLTIMLTKIINIHTAKSFINIINIIIFAYNLQIINRNDIYKELSEKQNEILKKELETNKIDIDELLNNRLQNTKIEYIFISIFYILINKLVVVDEKNNLHYISFFFQNRIDITLYYRYLNIDEIVKKIANFLSLPPPPAPVPVPVSDSSPASGPGRPTIQGEVTIISLKLKNKFNELPKNKKIDIINKAIIATNKYMIDLHLAKLQYIGECIFTNKHFQMQVKMLFIPF